MSRAAIIGRSPEPACPKGQAAVAKDKTGHHAAFRRLSGMGWPFCIAKATSEGMRQ